MQGRQAGRQAHIIVWNLNEPMSTENAVWLLVWELNSFLSFGTQKIHALFDYYLLFHVERKTKLFACAADIHDMNA